MQPTRPLFFRAFINRSIAELKRQTRSAIRQEGITGNYAPYTLLDFRNPETRNQCKTMYDGDIGGYSSVNLDAVSPPTNNQSYVRFHGIISTELPANRPDVKRSGYAAWRSEDLSSTLFGKGVWNIDPYSYVALRVKSDGRKYFVNIQTESIVPTDLHQHRLYARSPGEWETITIKWNDFVRTNLGTVVEPQTEMLRQKVKSIGIGLTDRVPGHYDLSISCIWATNNSHETSPEGN